MIIGNNNKNNFNQPSFNTNFNQRFNTVKENEAKNNQVNTKLNDNLQSFAHSDITSKNEMNDKAFAMLQERFNNGLISVEEFNRKCNELNNRR